MVAVVSHVFHIGLMYCIVEFFACSLFAENVLRLCELRMVYECERGVWFEMDSVIDILSYDDILVVMLMLSGPCQRMDRLR